MKHISSWEENIQIENLLRQNKIALAPSDTVIGLCGQISAQSWQRLNLIKGRQEKPYLILIGNFDQLEDFVDLERVPLKFFDLIQQYWPGPLTCVLPAKKNIGAHVKAVNDTVAIRLVKDEAIAKVAFSLGGLFSTSANLAGQPVISCLADIPEQMVSLIDFSIGDLSYKYPVVASTIVDVTQNSIKMIRPGQVIIDSSFML